MSHLTIEQLAELTERVNERLDEWGLPETVSFVRMNRGLVRSMIDVYHEWLEDNPPQPWPAAPDPLQGDPMMDGYHVGYERGFRAAVSELNQADSKRNGFKLERDPETGRLREVTPWDHLIPVTDNPEGDPPPSDEPLPTIPPPNLDASDLSAHWPELNDIPKGRDVFAQHPIAGAPEPPPKSDEKLTDDESPAAPVAPAIPRQPTPEVNGHAAPKPRTLAEVDEEVATRRAELDAIVGELQAMAVDGEMPTVSQWEEERGAESLAWKTITRRHGLSWADLARKAGLTYTRQGSLEPEVRELRAQAAAVAKEREISHEALLKEIKRIAMGKAMPTQTAFNDAKPAVWPTATALVTKFHTTWEELAEACGLDYQRGRKNVPARA